MNPQEKTSATTPSKNARRRLTVGYHSTDKPGVDVPAMRLYGRWLQEAGFVIGRHITVEVGEGRLTIQQDR
jgi:hypothetical protein